MESAEMDPPALSYRSPTIEGVNPKVSVPCLATLTDTLFSCYRYRIKSATKSSVVVALQPLLLTDNVVPWRERTQ